jgi:hypothetical protein
MLCNECATLYKATPVSRSEFVDTNKMSNLNPAKRNNLIWAEFVSKWNSSQPFHDDIYAIPKKGGLTYTEVKELYDLQRGVAPTEAPKPVVNEVVKPTKVPYPAVPTWSDLIRVDNANESEYWTDKLVTGYGGRSWAIPMLPKPSSYANEVKKKFPTLTNKQVNEILKSANEARRAARKE